MSFKKEVKEIMVVLRGGNLFTAIVMIITFWTITLILNLLVTQLTIES